MTEERFGADWNMPKLVLKQKRIKESVVGGFGWAVRQYSTCEEPFKGIMLKLLDDAIHRGMDQIMPTSICVCYAEIITVSSILKPVSLCDIQR